MELVIIVKLSDIFETIQNKQSWLIGCRNWFYSAQASVHFNPCGTCPGMPLVKSPMSRHFPMIKKFCYTLVPSKSSPSNAQNSEPRSMSKRPSQQSWALKVHTGCDSHPCLLEWAQKRGYRAALLSDLASGPSGRTNKCSVALQICVHISGLVFTTHLRTGKTSPSDGHL